MNVLEELATRCEKYPLCGQIKVRDKTVCAKLFFPIGAATWYVTEYDPKTKLAYGYVAGLGTDEWGYFSVAELLAIRIEGVISLEVDLYFNPVRFSTLGVER